MTEFSTESLLDVSVSDRSLNQARSTIQQELGGVTVSVDASSSATAGAVGRIAGKERAMSRQLLTEANEFARDSLDVQQEILQEIKKNALSNTGGGGGGGITGFLAGARLAGGGGLLGSATSAITGTISATSLVTGTVAAAGLVSGGVVINELVTGKMEPQDFLTGSIKAGELLTGGLSPNDFVSGTIGIASLVGGSLTLASYVSGSITLGGYVTGTLGASTLITGAVTAGALITGTLAVGALIVGTVVISDYIAGKIVASDLLKTDQDHTPGNPKRKKSDIYGDGVNRPSNVPGQGFSGYFGGNTLPERRQYADFNNSTIPDPESIRAPTNGPNIDTTPWDDSNSTRTNKAAEKRQNTTVTAEAHATVEGTREREVERIVDEKAQEMAEQLRQEFSRGR